MIDRKDAEFLLQRPEFKRFLYAMIQTSGYIGINAGADGRSVRDQCLEWHEGRRSLGHDLLLMVEEGVHDALRSPDGLPIATLEAVLREGMNPKETPKENPDDDRY